MKKLLVFITVLALAFTLVACSGGGNNGGGNGTEQPSGNGAEQPAGAAGYRDEINIGMDVDPETYNPVIWKNTTSSRVGQLIYDGLTYNDVNLNSVPALATSWENPDELTWIFHLREGVKFHNGKDFTAADVKYTYESILNEENNAPYRSRYTAIESMDIIDDHTIQFNLSTPAAAMLVYMDLGILPEGAMEEFNVDTSPIGTGAYSLARYDLNSVTVLEANPEYWGGAPATKTINVYIINDNSVRIAALQSGDVDFICSPLTASDLVILENDPSIVFNKTAALGITYLGFNVDHPVLSDLAVRQAIAHMVDKETIASAMYGGMDTPGETPLQYISWAWDESLKGYDFDPDAAVQVLEDAGWVLNANGIREKDGQTLSFELSTHTDDTSRFLVVEYMQNALTNIGMEVTVSVTEWATFSQDMMDHKTEVWVAGWLNLLDPDRMFDMFHSTSGSNYGGYNNPRVDELLMTGRTVSDPEVRAAAYQEAAQIVTDEVFYVTMLDQAYICAYSDKLENYVIHPSGYITAMKQVVIAQ